MPHRTRSASTTCGQGFQAKPVPLPSRHQLEDGKPLSVLRRNMTFSLSRYGQYLYSGTQIDAVLAIAQDFAADGYVATRYRAGVCVQHVSQPPLEVQFVRVLNGTMSQQEWATAQVDVIPTFGKQGTTLAQGTVFEFRVRPVTGRTAFP